MAQSFTGTNHEGTAYVVFGGSGVGASGSIDLPSLGATQGVVIQGLEPGSRFGYAVAGAGDLNDDGNDDVIIGAYKASPGGVSEAGEVYAIFGGPSVGASGSFDPASLDGTNGFVVEGRLAADWNGFAIAGGDVDSDGVDDLITGAPRAASFTGESYVIFGRHFCVADLDGNGATDIADFGILAGSFGQSVSPAGSDGDVNGDGVVNIYDFAVIAGDFGCVP